MNNEHRGNCTQHVSLFIKTKAIESEQVNCKLFINLNFLFFFTTQ